MFSHVTQVYGGPIPPTVDGSVRDALPSGGDGIPDNVIGNSIVQAAHSPIFEDRGILEFDISSLSGPVPTIMLQLNRFGANGPFPFTVDVFTYAGDGLMTLADFNAGTLFTSFDYSGEPVVILDVTLPIANLVASSESFAGFNLQFAVPSAIQTNGPFVAFNSLEFPPAAALIIPEPSTLTLTTLVLLTLLAHSHRRRRA